MALTTPSEYLPNFPRALTTYEPTLLGAYQDRRIVSPVSSFSDGNFGWEAAVTDSEDEGFVKIHAKKGSDRILGATVVASHAGEMISEVTLAIVNKLGLGAILNTIHPYPTQAEALKRAAGAYVRTRATPRVSRFLERFMALRR